MAAAMVASHHQPLSSPSSPELRKTLSTTGPRSNQKPPMPSAPADRPAGKSASVPRGKRERPCDACRRRKSKCVVTEASKACAACGAHGQECTYVEDPQPRKRKTDGDAQSPENSKRRSRLSPSSDISSAPSLARQDSTASSTRPPVPSSKPLALAEPPSLVSEQECGMHVGATTELEPLILELTCGSPSSISSLYQMRGSSPFLLDRASSEHSKTMSITSMGALEAIVGSQGPLLLKTYLTHVHPAFPIISSSFFASYHAGNIASLSPVLLSAVFTSTIPFLSSPLDLPALEQFSFSLFSDSLSNPSLATIQAGLLLMQRPGTDTRALNTQLVSAAHDLGLQVDPTTWGLSPADTRLRKRLAWAVYVQDKWSALTHGRPSLISASNWAVPMLTPSDFDTLSPEVLDDEDYPGPTSSEVFTELVRLTTILATVLDTFYTLSAQADAQAHGAGATRAILEKAKPVQIRLKEWFSGLRSGLRMDSGASSSAQGSPAPDVPDAVAGATAFLHLAYFATEITLHRCIIRSLHAPPPPPPTSSINTTSSGGGGGGGGGGNSSSSKPDLVLTHVCRAAAKTRLISAMDFLNRLRPRHHGTLALFFAAPACFGLAVSFGALLRATSPAREEEEFYRQRLGELRWTLAVSAGAVSGWNSSGGGGGGGGGIEEGGGEGGQRSGSGVGWLGEALAWVDVWDELCAKMPTKERAEDLARKAAKERRTLGSSHGRSMGEEGTLGAGRMTPVGGVVDDEKDGEDEDVIDVDADEDREEAVGRAVRFVQIGHGGDTGLASPSVSVSTESGGSYEAWVSVERR